MSKQKDDDAAPLHGIVMSRNGTPVRVPHNVTEYFDMDPLPCPVVGCHFAGQKIGGHCTVIHGIDGEELRELLGANKTQGLCTKDFSKRRSRLTKDQETNVLISGEQRFDITKVNRASRQPSRQAMETHATVREDEQVKAGLRRGGECSRDEHRRKQQGKRVVQVIEAMPYVDQVCDECGETYQTKTYRLGYSRFCGQRCRNAYNNRRRRSST